MQQYGESQGEAARREGGAITSPLAQEGSAQQPPYVAPEMRPAYDAGTYQPQQAPQDRRHHRTSIFGPLLLIMAGIVFLLNTLDVIDWSIWESLSRLWPLVLIASGIDLLVGRRKPVLSVLLVLGVLAAGSALIFSGGGFRHAGEVARHEFAVPHGQAERAEVEIDFDAGNLTIGSDLAPGDPHLARGTLQFYENREAPGPEIDMDRDVTRLRLSQPERRGFSMFNKGGSEVLAWDINLNPSVPMEIKIDSGAGATTIDMEDMKVQNLDLDSGTGRLTVVFPANAGETTASISEGTGPIDVTIPEGVEARIEIDSGRGDVRVDPRFTLRDDVYMSSGYESAENKLTLKIDVGLGEVQIRSR